MAGWRRQNRDRAGPGVGEGKKTTWPQSADCLSTPPSYREPPPGLRGPHNDGDSTAPRQITGEKEPINQHIT